MPHSLRPWPHQVYHLVFMTGNLLIKIAWLISRMSSRHRCESNSHKANNDKQWWKWHENGVHFEPSLSQHAKGNSVCGFHRNHIIRLSSDQAVKEPFGSAPKHCEYCEFIKKITADAQGMRHWDKYPFLHLSYWIQALYFQSCVK